MLLEPRCTHPITSSRHYLLLAKICTKMASKHSINRIFRFQHSACYLFWDTMYVEIISFLRFFLSLKMFIFSSFKLRARISKHKQLIPLGAQIIMHNLQESWNKKRENKGVGTVLMQSLCSQSLQNQTNFPSFLYCILVFVFAYISCICILSQCKTKLILP